MPEPPISSDQSRDLYSIVVPTFNSTDTLGQLAMRIAAVFAEMPGVDYEIIFVDDASPNRETWAVLTRLADRQPNVRCIQLMRNFGQQAATLCGISHARGNYVITMDDDLQHAPEDIPFLIAQREHDVVMASFPELKHSLYKRLLSWFKNLVLSVLIGKPFNLQVTAYRLIKCEVARAIVSMVASPHSTLPPLIFFVTKDVVAVSAGHNPRAEGRSNYTLRRVLRTARALIFDETVLLLKVIGYLGFCVCAVSFVAGLLVVVRRVMVGTSVQGWASTIIVLLVMGGLVLFCLGVIGEYLTRMINGIERRPAFVVRQEHAHGGPTSFRETAPTATTPR